MKYLLIALTLFLAAVSWLDRHFLKESDSFCIGNIHGKAPFSFEAPPLSLPPDWEEIASQSFHYLKRGHQSYVFLSDDGKSVIKFYRFPSELRAHPWLSHPFSFLSKKRQAIRKYNLKKLKESFQSFRLASEELQKETGLLMVHLAPTQTLKKKIRLYDRLETSYEVDLDRVVFLLQRRAELIFPHLETLFQKNEKEKIQQKVSNIIHLIAERCSKGIVDRDAVLEKNYGILNDEAILIDVGRLVFDESVKMRTRDEVEKITAPLKTWLEARDRDLLQAYELALQAL